MRYYTHRDAFESRDSLNIESQPAANGNVYPTIMDNARNNHSEDNPLQTPTTKYLQSRISAVEDTLPLNISFLTNHIRDAYISRISDFEFYCGRNRIFAFLVRKGVSPRLLFLAVTIGTVFTLHRIYKSSVNVVTQIVGVVYPVYKSLKALEGLDASEGREGVSDDALERARETQRQWLTYWVVFGSFQVADSWAEWILEMFPYYNAAKIISFYWAQNDRTRGATILYNNILRPLMNKRLQSSSKKVNGPVPAWPQSQPIIRHNDPSEKLIASQTPIPYKLDTSDLNHNLQNSDDDAYHSGFLDIDSNEKHGW